MEAKDRIICALDFRSTAVAYDMVQLLQPHVGSVFKVGLMLLLAGGLDPLNFLRSVGLSVFLDLKFHDTPETVAGAAAIATEFGVSMLNVHCGGGVPMMAAAKQAVDEAMELPAVRARNLGRPKVLAVTALTSQRALDFEREGSIQVNEDAPGRAVASVFDEVVMRRALLAQEVGLDGVVTSARFVPHVREACGQNFLIVTPGVHMVATAGEAVRDGADYVVIGRLFSQSRDPVAVAYDITQVIAAAMAEKETT